MSEWSPVSFSQNRKSDFEADAMLFVSSAV